MIIPARQNRSILSCAIAPLALPLLATPGGESANGSSWCLALGASLLIGGVLSRWASRLVPRRCNGTEHHGAYSTTPTCLEKPAAPMLPGSDDRAKLVQRFLDQGRTAILLRPQIARTLESEHFHVIQQLFQQETALIAGGEVVLSDWTFEETDPAPNMAPKQQVEVAAFYLDRYTITNRQYQQFVADGGYGQQAVWDPSIWSRVNEFVDRTGTAGPRYWNRGAHLPGEEDLPVIGVNWFEADAYARWAGRRLPSDAEWVKAGACPHASIDQETVLKKYPWGDNFELQRANVWISGTGAPMPVTAPKLTRSKEDIAQLIGNVWEWTSSDAKITSYGRDVRFEIPLKSLRGGAFDTYFENQATCQLQSGDSPLARRRNVGFRCALTASDVIEIGVPS